MIFQKKLTREKKALMFERMGMLLSNSMSPAEVFTNLAEEFKVVAPQLTYCARKTKDGSSMIATMNEVKLLSRDELVTLSSGEKSGKLPETFESLASFGEIIDEQIKSVQKKVFPNLGYLFAAMAVLYGMMLFMVPNIAMNIKPEKQAKFAVFGLSEKVIYFHYNYAIYALVAVIALTILIANKLNTAQGKDAITNFLLKIPVIKDGILTFSLAMWAKQTSMMISAGVSFNDVIDLTANSLPLKIRLGMNNILKDVQASGWQSALNKKNWSDNDHRRTWPPEIFGALLSGGDTGTLEHTLNRLGISLEKSSRRIIERSTKILSTGTFMLAASSVAFVMISVITASMAGISK